jgi:glycosyltransferase involved in cell wall biosynthesis
VDKERRRLVQSLLAGPLGAKFENPVQWFYDPMAVTAFYGHMNETATVYDCMDQLSQFLGAHPELVRRESELLAVADVVFAGGPKIHRAKSAQNTNCHSFGCGVDVRHFGEARRAGAAVPGEIAHLQGPVLGFFGVVDERMDYELVAKLADAEPGWNLVLIGPRTKVEESVLPQRPNIHWIGARDYSQLPNYAWRFDVCLMPFALNEATEYINPTKALEYMATGKPIVSSAVEDVVLQFSKVVAIARTHEQFVDLCRRAVEQPNRVRIRRGLELSAANSWEAIVRKLKSHINDVLAAKEAAIISEGNAA